MPTELRQLIFSPDELAEAITAHRPRTPASLPTGAIVMCQVLDGTDLQVNVKILPEGSDDLMNVQLDSGFVGSCLVRYCLEHKIPLPTGSVRYLQAISGNVALNLSLGAKRSELPDYV